MISAVSRYLNCLAVSQLPRCLHQAPYLHFHLSSFIFHRTPARKSSERLFSPSQRPPRSFLKGFSLRFSVLPKVSRLLHLKSRDSCYISISLRPRCLRQAPYLHFHLSSDALPKVFREAFLSESASSRKFPKRLFSPSQHPPESFPTTPPEISRFLLPLDISTASRYLYCLAVFIRRHFSIFIFHLSSLIGRPPESFPRGFSLRFSILPKVS